MSRMIIHFFYFFYYKLFHRLTTKLPTFFIKEAAFFPSWIGKALWLLYSNFDLFYLSRDEDHTYMHTSHSFIYTRSLRVSHLSSFRLKRTTILIPRPLQWMNNSLSRHPSSAAAAFVKTKLLACFKTGHGDLLAVLFFFFFLASSVLL